MSQSQLERPLLTKYPAASLRETMALALPIMLSFLSYSLMNFCDRVFLSHYSLESLHGCVFGGYLWNMFQHPVVRLVSMAQVFVGLYYGGNKNKLIGSAVWQMIWIAIFSMVFTLPCGLLTSSLVFKGTAIQSQAETYFTALMWGNFLFPLGTAIAAYFVGMGKGGVIVWTTLSAHIINVFLDYALIFGIPNVLAPQGELGAALATNISQLVYCVILLSLFLGKRQRNSYGTGAYQIRWESMLEQLKISFPRALTRLLLLMNWVLISRIVSLKGGDYLMTLSIGGTLIMLFTFVGEGMLQTQTVLASNLIGAKAYYKIGGLIRSGLLFVCMLGCLLAIPYLLFPEFMLKFFFPNQQIGLDTLVVLKKSCVWLWLFFICFGFETIGWGLLYAARDTLFTLFQALLAWLTGSLPVYFILGRNNGSPDLLWLIMAISLFVSGGAALIRGKMKNWQTPEHAKDFIV